MSAMLLSRDDGVIDGPLERVRRAGVIGPVPVPQLLDDTPARVHGPVLAELELGAASGDPKRHAREMVERALVERIVHAERPVPSLGLVLGEEPLLLRENDRGILRHRRHAFEDHGAVIGRGRARVLGVHPVRGDDRQDFIHLEDAAGPDLEIGHLLVRPHQVELDGRRRVDEIVEADVGRAVLAHRHEPAHLLGRDEAVDLLGRDLRVVVVEDHVRANSSLAALTLVGSARRSKVVSAIVLAAASMPCRASGLTAASANSRVWMAIPTGAMPIMGWMAGSTWLTLPTSEEPLRSGMGSPSARPTDFMLAAKRSSSTRLDFIGSYTLSCCVTLRPQPAACAAPSAQATTRR